MVKKIPKAVMPEEFVRLYKGIKENDKKTKVAFILAYSSGLRISEIVGGEREKGEPIKPLTPERIDLGRKTITLLNAKYGTDRVVPLPKGWKDWMIKELPIKRSARSLEIKFKNYARKVGLPSHYTFHSLRHGFAVKSIEQGMPISHVQTLLGHSDISTTGVYLKARPLDALKSYEDLF